MNRSQISLVQSSFARVYAQKGELADRFYYHLFLGDPTLQPLFKNDFYKQKEMFLAILAATVSCMSEADKFRDIGQRLAAAHSNLGITVDQFENSADALMSALKDVMAGQYSNEEEEAWSSAIAHLIELMVEASVAQSADAVPLH